MDFFVRHLVDPTAIAQEPSLSNVVERVRETAVCLAVLGQVAHGTRLLEILHSHGVPPFDLHEPGPEKQSSADCARSWWLAKGDPEEYSVPVNPPRSDPFTRAVFAFAWEHTDSWPSWATPAPVPLPFNHSSGPGGSEAEQNQETTLDALERYARLVVCNRFGHRWREDEETYLLVRDLGELQKNRANPHGPIPSRLLKWWGLWERMLAPWPMNQIVKSTGRVLALDLAFRLGRQRKDEENGEEEEDVIDEFIVDEVFEDKAIGVDKYNKDAIESWGRFIANQHDAQDQMPMLGSMRTLWRVGWFNDPKQNMFVKILGLDLEQIRKVAETGCDMVVKRLRDGPIRPYEGATVSELVRAIDDNTRANGPYYPDWNTETRDAGMGNASREFDADKVFRPDTLLRRPVPTHQEIAELEKRLELSAPLPDQYKAFLRTTNGMGSIWWNESQLIRLLSPIDGVKIAEDDLPTLSLELIPERGLRGDDCISWPTMRRAVQIGAGGNDGEVWLVEPKYVQEAKASFFEVYDSRPEEGRALLRREAEEVYGSIEALRELKWAVLLWTGWFAEMWPCRDFAALLESLAVGSQRKMRSWSIHFDPGFRKLHAHFYLPADEWDEDDESQVVEDSKGNLVVNADGTITMGENVYPELAICKPKVDH